MKRVTFAVSQRRNRVFRLVIFAAISVTLFLSATKSFLPASEVVSSAGDSREQKKALSPYELAAWIDDQLDLVWKDQGVIPAPATDDSEFVRRLY